MIRFDNIEQGTLPWFQKKWGKIGGTLSAGLFINSEALMIDILSQRLEEFEPEDGFCSADMERGNEMEPFARDYLNDYTGLKFEETGWLQSEENELLGISPDGITNNNISACEIKCFARKMHTEVLLKEVIPRKNINQCIHYFTVNPNLKELYWIAFRPESPNHFIKILTLDSEINIGTEKKPKKMIISECVKIAQAQADVLLTEILENEEKLKF